MLSYFWLINIFIGYDAAGQLSLTVIRLVLESQTVFLVANQCLLAIMYKH